MAVEEHEHIQRIRSTLDAAMASLAELPAEARAESGDDMALIEKALAFARLSLDGTDPELVTSEAQAALQQGADQIAADPATAVTQAVIHHDALIAAALLLPVARGRDVEQIARDAAANYQRAMAQRIHSLEKEIAAAEAALAEARAGVGSTSDAFTATINEKTEELQTEIDALDAVIKAHQATLDAQLTRHTDAFNTSQQENAAKFQAQVETFNEQMNELRARTESEVQEAVESVRVIAEDVGVLAGAIALKETADRYADEANAQRKVANALRALTVLVALVAVGVAVWAVIRHASDTNTLVAKIAASTVLGGLATYTATQSGRHRRREVKAKDLQLQLTAFSPFIAPLAPELQQVERVRMARRTFGAGGAKEEDDELGPTFLSFVRQLVRGAPEGEIVDET